MPGEACPWKNTWVATARSVVAAEEVVEPDLVERGRRGVGPDVPPGTSLDVGAVDHDRGVPPDVAADPLLQRFVTGEIRLPLGRDRVDVVRGGQRRDADVLLASSLQDLQEQEPTADRPMLLDHRVEGLEPLARLGLVHVGVLVRDPVGDDLSLVAVRHGSLLVGRSAVGDGAEGGRALGPDRRDTQR
jgi:hypothetical protein